MSSWDCGMMVPFRAESRPRMREYTSLRRFATLGKVLYGEEAVDNKIDCSMASRRSHAARIASKWGFGRS